MRILIPTAGAEWNSVNVLRKFGRATECGLHVF